MSINKGSKKASWVITLRVKSSFPRLPAVEEKRRAVQRAASDDPKMLGPNNAATPDYSKSRDRWRYKEPQISFRSGNWRSCSFRTRAVLVFGLRFRMKVRIELWFLPFFSGDRVLKGFTRLLIVVCEHEYFERLDTVLHIYSDTWKCL